MLVFHYDLLFYIVLLIYNSLIIKRFKNTESVLAQLIFPLQWRKKDQEL